MDGRAASRTVAGSRPSGAAGPPTRARPGAPARHGAPNHPVRTALVLVSALVLVLSGTGWVLYRDLAAGITTTDVIVGGGDGGAQTILLVGVDSRADAKGNPLPPELLRELRAGEDTGVLNSDTIIVLHVPEGGGAAIAFSVPRDTYVDIPGYRRDKINAAYPATKALVAEDLAAAGVRDPARVEAESAQVGRSTLIKVVQRLTGLTVDHYAEVNLFGFYTLTTAIGGVEVCLNAPVDEELSGARFPAGPQTITGGDALAFVRQRHELPEGDLSRIRRQQVFLAAMADKVLSGDTLTDPARLDALAEAVRQSLVIDQGWDVLAFAQRASEIASGDLAFVTIPTLGQATTDRGSVVLADSLDVRAFVADRIAAAERGDAPADPADPRPADSAGYVVDVRNGSRTAGMAAAVASRMAELGYAPGTVDNTTTTPTTVVRHAAPDGEAARAVADQLGGVAVEGAEGPDVAPGHLLVVLGADFDPGTIPAAAGTAGGAGVPAAPAGDGVTAAGVRCID